jgi:hypothetical protein
MGELGFFPSPVVPRRGMPWAGEAVRQCVGEQESIWSVSLKPAFSAADAVWVWALV